MMTMACEWTFGCQLCVGTLHGGRVRSRELSGNRKRDQVLMGHVHQARETPRDRRRNYPVQPPRPPVGVGNLGGGVDRGRDVCCRTGVVACCGRCLVRGVQAPERAKGPKG